MMKIKWPIVLRSTMEAEKAELVKRHNEIVANNRKYHERDLEEEKGKTQKFLKTLVNIDAHYEHGYGEMGITVSFRDEWLKQAVYMAGYGGDVPWDYLVDRLTYMLKKELTGMSLGSFIRESQRPRRIRGKSMDMIAFDDVPYHTPRR